jgi:hypothetical protein
VGYNKDFQSILDKYSAKDLSIDAQKILYEEAFRKEEEILDMIQRSKHTQEIANADKERDLIARGFAETVEGSTRHFDPVVCDAAGKVAEILGHYGKIYRRSIIDASAAIDDIVRELNLPDNIALVKTAQLEPWLQGLSNANKKVVDLSRARYDELSERPKTNMKEARAAVDKLVWEIIYRLESIHFLFNRNDTVSDDNSTCISSLAVLNEKYRNTLALERGRRAAKRKTNPDDPDASPAAAGD